MRRWTPPSLHARRLEELLAEMRLAPAKCSTMWLGSLPENYFKAASTGELMMRTVRFQATSSAKKTLTRANSRSRARRTQ